MTECNYTIIFILFYIVALTFVMKTHFHYIGYILLLIVYLVNILYIMLNRTEYMAVIDKVFVPSPLTLFTQNNTFKLAMFLIVFFSLYSLIRMIDTYNYLIKQNKTYDINISSTYYKNNINRFNITFIINRKQFSPYTWMCCIITHIDLISIYISIINKIFFIKIL